MSDILKAFKNVADENSLHSQVSALSGKRRTAFTRKRRKELAQCVYYILFCRPR